MYAIRWLFKIKKMTKTFEVRTKIEMRYVIGYTRGGQTFLLKGQISLKYCIAGRKFFFDFKYDMIDVNLGYFCYKNS